MAEQHDRSEQVIEAYKRHKLAHSALRRIHELIRGFDAERAADRRLAWIGLVALLLLVALAWMFLAGNDRITLG